MNNPSASLHRSRPVGRLLAVGALAALLSACASVDLSERYVPPPVRMPGEQPLMATQPVAQPSYEAPLSQPVESIRAESQALPPLNASGATGDATGDDTNLAADPTAHIATFSTQLTSADTMPASGSMAHGQIDAIYDAQTRLLRWKASWSGLHSPITGIAFHGPAQPGQTAPITMIWPGPFGPRYEGRATLTPQQAADLQQGNWYISVTTQSWPNGEIRGQMRVVR